MEIAANKETNVPGICPHHVTNDSQEAIEYLTTRQASLKYNRSSWWFRQLRRQGGGPKFVKVGPKGHCLYSAAELEQFFARNTYICTTA